VPADRLLQWGIARCPLLCERMGGATGPEHNEVIANFSYRCRPYAGSGYYLVGDAAAFIDPIFSTGVYVATVGGLKAAEQIAAVLSGKLTPARARKHYIAHLDGGTKVFFRLIRQYYDHSFRELFLNGDGPHQMRGAVLAALAGHVFPRPIWAIRWRLALFNFFVALNRWKALVPRRAKVSLLAGHALAAEFTESSSPNLVPSPSGLTTRHFSAAGIPAGVPAPGGAAECSPRRQPWGKGSGRSNSPGGA
jgi:hypothetical protein